jgi:hypothetical protein
MKIKCELTDTFGGEANYAWVRRAEIDLPDNASDLLIMRRCKSALGLANVRCKKSDIGEVVELRPVGSCTIAFIYFN